jgi:hypothetical protein
MEPQQHQRDVDTILELCHLAGIVLDKCDVLAITCQKTFSSTYFSAVLDVKSKRLLTHYPNKDALSQYHETKLGPFMIAYCNALPALDVADLIEQVTLTDSDKPFCCSKIVPYKNKTLVGDREKMFDNFLDEHGHYPNIIFEVKRERDFGPLLSKTYFQLLHGKGVVRVPDENYHEKIHSFKNYKCPNHNLFFGVDLFAKSGERINRHHMRVNPYTAISPEMMAAIRSFIEEKPSEKETFNGRGDSGKIGKDQQKAESVDIAPHKTGPKETTAHDEQQEEEEKVDIVPNETVSIQPKVLSPVGKTTKTFRSEYDEDYEYQDKDYDIEACDSDCGYCGKCWKTVNWE